MLQLLEVKVSGNDVGLIGYRFCVSEGELGYSFGDYIPITVPKFQKMKKYFEINLISRRLFN